MATQQELAVIDSDRSFSIVAFLTGIGESKLSGNSDDDLSLVSMFCFFLFEDHLMLNIVIHRYGEMPIRYNIDISQSILLIPIQIPIVENLQLQRKQ